MKTVTNWLQSMDLTLCHTLRFEFSNRGCELLQHYKWEVPEHLPHSPDLTPSDICLLRPLMKWDQCVRSERIIPKFGDCMDN